VHRPNPLIPVTGRLASWMQRHPRQLTTLVVASLLGFGVTAFGVAPLAPDPADLPRRLVVEDLTPGSLVQQAQSLRVHDWRTYRSDQTRAGDTADTLLLRLGSDDPQAAAFLRRDALAQKLLQGRSGKGVDVELDQSGQVQRLTARLPADDAARSSTHFSRLTIEREGDSFRAGIEPAELKATVRLAGGTIHSSLFAATDAALLPDAVAIQIAEMFSAEIDFHRDLRKGDRFTVAYESLEADGQPVTWGHGTGRVLAAEFVNRDRSHRAVWFQEPGRARGAYYTFDGESLRRAFLASPMEFSRVTSRFGPRMHPILQKGRQHNGVDYGAPTGTPVRTVGDGVVEFAGWQNGYGNVIHIRHRGGRTTVYAHLSRIGVRKGQGVEQGQTIGNVGATGWATGPHLHFEFRENGRHVDPLRIARASESTPVSAAARPLFQQHAQAMALHLSMGESMALASAQ